MLPPRGACFLWGGVLPPGRVLAPGGCFLLGGSAPGGASSWGGVCVPGEDPPGRILLRAVRILLECILVLFFFFLEGSFHFLKSN